MAKKRASKKKLKKKAKRKPLKRKGAPKAAAKKRARKKMPKRLAKLVRKIKKAVKKYGAKGKPKPGGFVSGVTLAVSNPLASAVTTFSGSLASVFAGSLPGANLIDIAVLAAKAEADVIQGEFAGGEELSFALLVISPEGIEAGVLRAAHYPFSAWRLEDASQMLAEAELRFIVVPVAPGIINLSDAFANLLGTVVIVSTIGEKVDQRIAEAAASAVAVLPGSP